MTVRLPGSRMRAWYELRLRLPRTRNVLRMPMMLQPNAAPPVLRQIEQKQNRNGTGVSDWTENWTLPHWQDPSSLVGRFAFVFGLVGRLGMGESAGADAR